MSNLMSSITRKKMLMATRDYCLTMNSGTTRVLTFHRRLTCSAAATTPRLVPNPPDLVKWVRREGGFVHPSVRISESGPYGLGLVASAEIPKGSELIALPEHIPLRFPLIESDGGDESYSNLVNLARHVPEELWAMRLGLKLLQERSKTDSFWWPYISNLPETFTLPIFFPEEDIKNLQYAPLLYQVNKRCRFLLDFEKEVRREVEDVKLNAHPFGGKDVDASSLGWAMAAVSSRAFCLHGDVRLMLPLIDMCNHSFNPNAEIVQEQDQKMLVKVVAGMDIKEHDHMTLNYGCLSNDLFLLDYGFVVPSNPYDCIELKYDGDLFNTASTAAGVSNPSFSSPAPWQQQILSKLNLEGEEALLKVTLGGPEVVEGRLLAAVRVVLASDAGTVHKCDLDTLKSLSVEAPLGLAVEVAALRTLAVLCLIALSHFPTKVTEDESLLKQGVSTSTELALQFRIQKQSVITDVITDLTKRVKLLSENESLASQSESPSIQDESLTSQSESPATQDESPASQSESPATQDESPASQSESPATQGESLASQS